METGAGFVDGIVLTPEALIAGVRLLSDITIHSIRCSPTYPSAKDCKKPQMEQQFFFIDGMHADRAAKRRMRRHVMKGKNAGKTFQRRSKAGLQLVRRQPVANGISRSICNPLLTFPFPVVVTPVEGKTISDCKYLFRYACF